MKKEKIFKFKSRTWLVIVCVIGFSIFFYFVPKNLIGSLVVRSKDAQIIYGIPIKIKIPKIHVETNIEKVGLTPEGAVGAPQGRIAVAWFDLSPRPGDKGNAIIDGHFGWKNDLPAVFDDLNKLSPGDKIYIEDENNVVTVFVVRESKRYDLQTDSSAVFLSSDDRSHLNLITCEGVWDGVTKSYSKRLVVFADKEI